MFKNRLDSGLYRIADRLSRVIVENTDAVELMLQVSKFPNWSIYCDPPYPSSTRRGDKDYACDTTDDLHDRLLAAAVDAKAQIVISTYPNDQYERTLESWHRIDIPIHKVASSTQAEGTEVLYVNRLANESLF